MSLPDAEALYGALLASLRAAYGVDIPRLVGIHSGGVWLAERLAQDLGAGAPGELNVSLHRDDFAEKGLHGQASPTRLPFDVAGADILLVDDVLYTGRTIRAAINELYDYGRPARVTLAALYDRGERELPIAAQFVGAEVQVPAGFELVLRRADDGRLAAALEKRDA